MWTDLVVQKGVPGWAGLAGWLKLKLAGWLGVPGLDPGWRDPFWGPEIGPHHAGVANK